jgi:hypothetical protein
VICKNCGYAIYARQDVIGTVYLHLATDIRSCSPLTLAEPVPELTPAGLDLDLISNRLPALEEEEETTAKAAAALYRTVLRLAEKVGLE